MTLGVDVAGMGRDSSVLCYRYENVVDRFEMHQSGGVADHMHVAGMVSKALRDKNTYALIDTIGEGAGVFSRLREIGLDNSTSAKVSESASARKDITGQYEFSNMRAYLCWCVRDWLNPKNNFNAALPKNDKLMQEATEIKWRFQSDGKIVMEPKSDVSARIGRSPDIFDSLMLSFYPVKRYGTKATVFKY